MSTILYDSSGSSCIQSSKNVEYYQLTQEEFKTFFKKHKSRHWVIFIINIIQMKIMK